MKKIIILNHGLHIAGVSKTLVDYANNLVNRGHDVTIKIEIDDFTLAGLLDPRVKCSLFFKEPHIFGLRIKGFLRFYHIWRDFIFKLSPKWQYRFVVRHKYDVEIAFNRGAAARIISASTNKKSKKLVFVHNDYTKNDNPLAGFENLQDATDGYKKFDSIICVSEATQKAFTQKFGIDSNLEVIYNLIDYQGIIDKSKQDIGIPDHGKKRICIVGRLAQQKNHALLLKVCKRLSDNGIDYELWIVGDGPERNNIEKLIKEYGIDDKVMLFGSKENPYPYIANSDFTVCSSLYEGLPITSMESVILNKPIVSTCEVVTEFFGGHNCGVITENSEDGLYEGLKNMLTDEKLYKDCCDECLKNDQSGLNDVSLAQIEALF